MAQLYRFTDENGIVRLMAEIDPAPGGSPPAGSNSEIQYNDGGTAFGASPDLVWDAGNLKLVATENGAAEITGNGPGVQLHVRAADGDATHVGGELILGSGNSVGQNGGDLTIAAGADTADGDGGNLTIKSGTSVGGDGGEIIIRANPSGVPAGHGGQVLILAGDGTAGGGQLQIGAGGPNGSTQVYSGDGASSVILDNAGIAIASAKLGVFGTTPVTQPVVPMTVPTTQNVIDALLALGLVVQHD